MITFEPLASSSAGCAYKVSDGISAPLLLDCGMRFEELRKALDFRVTELAGCLLSHAHQDHSRAALGIARAGVNVYGSAETWRELKPGDAYKYRMMHLEPKGRYKIDEWTVLPFEAVHDVGTLGFLIGSPCEDRLLYLTDSCYSPFKFEGLTHVCVEANHSLSLMRENAEAGKIDRARFHRTARSHFSIERVEEMLVANDLSKVRELHLLHLSDSNSDEREFKSRLEKKFGIPVKVAAK